MNQQEPVLVPNKPMPGWVQALLQQQNNQFNATLNSIQTLMCEQANRQANANTNGNVNGTQVTMGSKFKYDDKDWTFYPTFHSQMVAKLEVDGPLFRSEQHKIWFVFGCLKKNAGV